MYKNKEFVHQAGKNENILDYSNMLSSVQVNVLCLSSATLRHNR